MSYARGLALGFLLVGVCLGGEPSRTGSEGQDDLDKAVQAKLGVRSLSDLSEVIRLAESAIKKGLDNDNTAFAKQLLASTLAQRGVLYSKSIFESVPPDPQWPDVRKAALQDLQRAVELNAQQPEALFRIAQLNLLPEGDRKRANEALDEAIRLSKGEPRLRAQAYALRAGLTKDPAKRLADLDEAVRTAPGDADVVRPAACSTCVKETSKAPSPTSTQRSSWNPTNPASSKKRPWCWRG